jgi:hypothetical protein
MAGVLRFADGGKGNVIPGGGSTGSSLECYECQKMIIMNIEQVPFKSVSWDEIPATIHPGETGFATWRTVEKGNLRVRLVEYSPGYLADHWCARGHVIHILAGEMVSELKDGSQSNLEAGMTYMMGDNPVNPHRSSTIHGVTLFIVD